MVPIVKGFIFLSQITESIKLSYYSILVVAKYLDFVHKYVALRLDLILRYYILLLPFHSHLDSFLLVIPVHHSRLHLGIDSCLHQCSFLDRKLME